MSDYLTHITEAEFLKQTLCPKNALQIEFENCNFKKGPTFSITMREQAIKYCQIMMTKQLKSLIVENKQCLTIWIQQQDTQSPQSTSQLALLSSPKQPLQSNLNLEESTKSNSQIRQYRGHTYKVETNLPKVPTKKVIKTYRGQTYEVEIPDYSATEQK